MSTATELLRLVVHEITAYGQVTYKTLEQIENLLAAEPEAEPVGYAVKMIPRGLHFIGFVGEEETDEEIEEYGPDQIVPLYTRPEPARKPMTEDAEDEAFNSASKYAAWLETENRMLRESRKPITKREMLTWYDELRPKSVADFVLGVRFAERYHGIGGDDD